MAVGKPVKLEDGKKYYPLGASEESAEVVTDMLSFVEEASSDIANLFDVVQQQNLLLQAQAMALEELRAELTRLRAERVAADTIERMQKAVTDAGYSARDYEVEIKITTSQESMDEEAAAGTRSQWNNRESQKALASTLGKVHDWIAGATLSGDTSKFEVDQFASSLSGVWRGVNRTLTDYVAHVKIGELLAPRTP